MKNIHFIPDDLQYSDKVSSQEDIKEVLLSYNSHNAIEKLGYVQYFQASFIAFHWLHIKCAQMTSLTFTKINTNLFTTQLLILTHPQIRKSGQNQMSFISDHSDITWTVNTQENAAIKLHYYLSSSVPHPHLKPLDWAPDKETLRLELDPNLLATEYQREVLWSILMTASRLHNSQRNGDSQSAQKAYTSDGPTEAHTCHPETRPSTVSRILDTIILIFILVALWLIRGDFEDEIFQRELRKLLCCIYCTCSQAHNAFRFEQMLHSSLSASKTDVAHCEINTPQVISQMHVFEKQSSRLRSGKPRLYE